MKKKAMKKGDSLGNRLYIIAGGFLLFLFFVRFLRLSYDTATLLTASYCLATVCYYIYEVVRGFKSYFYAYALGVRKRAPSGRTAWPFLLVVILLFSLAVSWWLATNFENNVHAFLDGGPVKALIATDIAAGFVVVIFSVLFCYLIYLCRSLRKA